MIRWKAKKQLREDIAVSEVNLKTVTILRRQKVMVLLSKLAEKGEADFNEVVS